MRRTRSSALWHILLIGGIALLLCIVAAVMLRQSGAAHAQPSNLARLPDTPPLRGALLLRTIKQMSPSLPAESTLVTLPHASFSIAVHAHLDKVSDFIRTRGSWEPELLSSIVREFPPTSGGADARLQCLSTSARISGARSPGTFLHVIRAHPQ